MSLPLREYLRQTGPLIEESAPRTSERDKAAVARLLSQARRKSHEACAYTSLGSGVGGEVYSTCASTGPSCVGCVAIKTVARYEDTRFDEFTVAARLRTALRNAEAARHLTVTYRTVHLDAERSVLFMERLVPAVPGSLTLASLLATGKLSAGELRSITAQVLCTLYEAQVALPGFGHHDLHAENVAVVPWPRGVADETTETDWGTFRVSPCRFYTKIMDFGLAYIADAAVPQPRKHWRRHDDAAGRHETSHPIGNDGRPCLSRICGPSCRLR